ncbi:hypothetical protein PG990_002067 [Apiospora arundinis]|uniref:Uncharacterized protein n=1 Tax=Apiospora arundinis TaxID=335852 RepID=A0ABR2I3T6_9PEZI
MKFQIAFLAALVGIVAAAPGGDIPSLEERQCLPNGAVCTDRAKCCSGNCFWGNYPSDPSHCG